jgi:YbbR domain-containing protein
MPILRWLWENKGSVLLSFLLSFTVWVAAVTTEDPTIERTFEQSIPIQYIPPRTGLVLLGEPPKTAQITLRAPESVWAQLTAHDIELQVDLSQLEPGGYTIPLQPQVNLKPVRITQVDPPSIRVTIEPLVSKEIPVTVQVIGEPALGFDAAAPQYQPLQVIVSGPESRVTLVRQALALVEISGARAAVDTEVTLTPVDAFDEAVEDVHLEPERLRVQIAVEQGDRYRLVSVIPRIEGTPEYGFRINSIQVVPDQVIVTSTDPRALDTLPGFVETEAIDLTGARETIERRALLDLPEGFSLVGTQTVLVRVSITAITNSITLIMPVQIQGLAPGLEAQASPNTVTVFLTGPLATLEELKPEDVLVVLNLVDLDEGVHTVTPEVIVPQVEVTAETLPSTVEVTIRPASSIPAP